MSNVRSMRNARYNQMRKNLRTLEVLTADKSAGEVTDEDMMNWRVVVEEIAQHFHEFNAYRDAYKNG